MSRPILDKSGRGLQGRGRGSDKGPIRVAVGTSERQKKPSVTRSFNRLLPASVLSRQKSEPFPSIYIYR